MNSRPMPMIAATTRKIAPAATSNESTANAMANETVVWSLGNVASVVFDHGWLIWCDSYGRGRSYAWWITNATTYESAAAANPLPHASFHFRSPPGRLRNQRAAVMTTITGMLAFSMSEKSVPTQWWWRETS